MKKNFNMVEQTAFLKTAFSMSNSAEYEDCIDQVLCSVNFEEAAFDLVNEASWTMLGMIVDYLGIHSALAREIESIARESGQMLDNELLAYVVSQINPAWQAKDRWREKAIHYICSSGNWAKMGNLVLGDKNGERVLSFVQTIVKQMSATSCQRLLERFDVDTSKYEHEVGRIFAVDGLLAEKLKKSGRMVTRIDGAWFWSVPPWVESVEEEIERLV